MRRIAILFLGMLCAIPVFSQKLVFEPGKTTKDEEGLTSYSSEPSAIKLLNPMVYMNLVSRESNSDYDYFIVISLSVKALDKVSENSALQLDFANGEVMTLPVNEGVIWDANSAPQKKSTEISLINIPYRVSQEQIDYISSSSVSRITIPGVDKTVSFSVKGSVLSNVMKREYKQISDMISGSMNKQTGHTTLAQSKNKVNVSNHSASSIIHETPNTKSFTVSRLNDLSLYGYHEGYALVLETNTGIVHVFDETGSLTGDFRTKNRSEYYADHFVSDGVIVNNSYAYKASIFTAPQPSRSGEKDGCSLLNVKGETILNLDHLVYGNFVDGLAYRNDSDHTYYMDKKGVRVFPSAKSDVEILRNPSPIIDNRRKIFTCIPTPRMNRMEMVAAARYGFWDEKNNQVIPSIYNLAKDFSEGLAAVCKADGNQEFWGYIDKNGNTVIDFIFTIEPGDFHDGFACVTKKSGKKVYINTKGIVISPEYNDASDFFNGYAFVKTNQGVSLIDTNFVEIRKNMTSMPLWVSKKNNLYRENGDVRKIDTGELVFCCKGCSIGDFHDEGLTWFVNETEKGYINNKGEIVLRFIESEF